MIKIALSAKCRKSSFDVMRQLQKDNKAVASSRCEIPDRRAACFLMLRSKDGAD